MRRKRVYIAGAITGDPDYKKKFEEVAAELINLGYEPVNPATAKEGKPYRWYINRGLKMLTVCDAICMISGWRTKSAGAQLEYNYAETVGIPKMRARKSHGEWTVEPWYLPQALAPSQK